MKLTYRPTNDGDLMQIVDGHDVGTLGVQLAPDTADLFAAAPELLAALQGLLSAAELPAAFVSRDWARRLTAAQAALAMAGVKETT